MEEYSNWTEYCPNCGKTVKPIVVGISRGEDDPGWQANCPDCHDLLNED
jgi:ssDNA-binding Zn-finger/Zn-ribbon topoisomerase 1